MRQIVRSSAGESADLQIDMRRLSFLVLLLAGIFLLVNGCATPGLPGSRNLFYKGDLEEAEARVESVRRARGRNRVLFLMERGLIYHTNDRYEKSNRDLLEAARQLETLETVKVAEQTGSFFSNDLLLTYRGEPFERVLIHTYSALNFLKLRKWENALVECKMALKELERSPFSYSQPFTNYLAGVSYEIMDEYDDARIEYEKVLKARPDIPFLKHDIERVLAGRKSSGRGELICFIQIGKSSIKVPFEVFVPPDKRFVLPEYRSRNYLCRRAVVAVEPVCSLTVPSCGGQMSVSSESYLLTDLESVAGKVMKERMEKEIAREVARLAAKERISREVERESSELAGDITRIGFMLLESADTRSWQTLPAKLEVARLSLEPGTYGVRIRFLDAKSRMLEESFFEQVEVNPEKVVFLICRSVL